jgi:hypothetical protein
MSTISTTNFEAGDTTDRTDANNKFSAVATATGSINEENVRSEGIDRRTLTSVASGRTEPIVFIDYDDRDNSAATTHAAQTGEASVVLSNVALDMTSSPVTVTDGDLIRIHYTAFLTSINDGPYATYGAAGEDHGGATASNPADAIGVVFFPTWQLSSGGAFSALTNEANWLSSLTAPDGIAINNTTAKSDSIAFCSMEGYLNTDCFPVRQIHGCWNYKHTGADITLYQIQLNMRGPMVYQYTGGNRVFYAPSWGAGRYARTCMNIPFSAAAPAPVITDFTIVVGNAQLSLTVMRGDS